MTLQELFVKSPWRAIHLIAFQVSRAARKRAGDTLFTTEELATLQAATEEFVAQIESYLAGPKPSAGRFGARVTLTEDPQ